MWNNFRDPRPTPLRCVGVHGHTAPPVEMMLPLSQQQLMLAAESESEMTREEMVQYQLIIDHSDQTLTPSTLQYYAILTTNPLSAGIVCATIRLKVDNCRLLNGW